MYNRANRNLSFFLFLQGMLGQGPHRFIWPDTVEVSMPTVPALQNMLTTNQWPHLSY